jgi:hypothetical protein
MPLYDFLYQDSSRLSSLQQQLGTATALETLDALRNGGHVRTDIRSGSLGFVELTGDLFLLSKGLMQFATSTVGGDMENDDFDYDEDDEDFGEDDFDEEDDEDEDDDDDEEMDLALPSGFNPVRTLFDQVGIPSIFVVRGRQGEVAGGAFNESYLIDSVASLYLRSAPGAIQRVTVIGLSEPLPGKDMTPLPPGLTEAVFPMMSNILGPLLPEDAARITPVLMYREIGSAGTTGGGPRKMIR